MTLDEAREILDPWIQHAKTKIYMGQPWPAGSLAGFFDRLEIAWYVNEQELVGNSPHKRWPYLEGRLKPRVGEALAVWTLYHGGPGMLEE